MSPLTEPDMKFSLIRLFRSTSATFVWIGHRNDISSVLAVD